MKNLSVIAVLGIVLLVAGCTGTSRPVTVDANEGLQIKEFLPDRSDIFSSETIILDMEVENVGGTAAENVVAKLFGGISGWTGDAAAEKTMGRGSSNALSAPSADRNIPGDFNRKSWNVKAPDLAQGLIQTYDLGMRVRYDYTTTSITSIDIISYDQFDLLRRQGSFVQDLTVTKNSYAPIKIALEGRAPMRPDSPGGGVEESLILTISNVGSGVPFRDTGSANDFPTQTSLGRITFLIETSKGNDVLRCDTGDGSLVNTGTVTLRRGVEEVRIPCILKIDATKISAGVPKETMSATITAGYSYAIDGVVPVKVTSMRDTVAGLPSTPPAGATTTVPGSATTTTIASPSELRFYIAARYFDDSSNNGIWGSGEALLNGLDNVQLRPPTCAVNTDSIRFSSTNTDITGNTENILYNLEHPTKNPASTCGSDVTYEMKITLRSGYEVGNINTPGGLGDQCKTGRKNDCVIQIQVSKLDAQEGKVYRIEIPVRRTS
ncbi:MAG: hypothetical protein HY364_05360 [Candidatus Aenigmarchaeota archaeon]|nr:hypothetical protein [Candidatus Aenigmarchaeota archaeon]